MSVKDDDFFYAKGPEEEKTSAKKEYLRTGVLRKKGLIFHNEREVRIDADGILTYYHFDSLDLPRGNIDLKHHSVQAVRFEYAGRKKPDPSSKRNSTNLQSNRPLPHPDDEIRIYMRNKESETFIFRASKIKTNDNPSIESWERTIRKFGKKVHVVQLH